MTDTVLSSLRQEKRVRRVLPEIGEVYFDRLLPFVAIVRDNPRRPESALRRLIRTQSAFVVGMRERTPDAAGNRFVSHIGAALAREFGSFLVLEVWIDSRLSSRSGEAYPVELHVPSDRLTDSVFRKFYHDLSRVRAASETLAVSYRGGRTSPPGLHPISASGDSGDLAAGGADSAPFVQIGLSLGAWFRDSFQDAPLLYRRLRARLATAIQRLFFRYVAEHTRLRPPHFRALGPRAFTSATRTVDKKLSTLGRSFDLLTSLTPVNVDQCWSAFRRSKYQTSPRFIYRPIAANPDDLKRSVWAVPVDRVEDPSIEALFRAKQRELDIQASLLLERGTSGVRYNSLRLYGPVTDDLLGEAQQVLAARLKKRRAAGAGIDRKKVITATQFCKRAQSELDRFLLTPSVRDLAVPLTAEVRAGVSGIVTVQGRVLIGKSLRVAPHRVEALIQHEVGTHVLTFVNGLVQPLSLLGTGLDGYEAFQEGVALLAEFFSGGLDRERLRLIAARVLAAHSVQEGADFVETYRVVKTEAGLTAKRAFMVAMRVHRSGGFIKDHIYLQGLSQALSFLAAGGDLSLLWAGKVAASHAQFLEELRYREMLVPPVVRPSYDPDVELLRQCLSPTDLPSVSLAILENKQGEREQ